MTTWLEYNQIPQSGYVLAMAKSNNTPLVGYFNCDSQTFNCDNPILPVHKNPKNYVFMPFELPKYDIVQNLLEQQPVKVFLNGKLHEFTAQGDDYTFKGNGATIRLSYDGDFPDCTAEDQLRIFCNATGVIIID